MNMKDIKDYLHLYFGCDVFYGQWNNYRLKFIGIEGDDVVTFDDYNGRKHWNIKTIKPILRPLSSMTEDEAKECGNLVYDFSEDAELNNWNWKDYQTLLASEQFIWLLSKHFDLFNLIEEGLAIDPTKQNSEPAAQESDTTKAT